MKYVQSMGGFVGHLRQQREKQEDPKHDIFRAFSFALESP